MKKIRIVLADDHLVVREGLKLLLNAQPDMEVIGEAGNGQDAWRQGVELQPDVVVMDVAMPGCGGAQATVHLKESCPKVKVLALTLYDEEGYLRQLLKAGASGYVLKSGAPQELIHAIRLVAGGGVCLDTNLAAKVMGSYVGNPSSAAQPRARDLSEREAEVLRLIAWGYSNKEIAARLHISVKTVETHRTRLMEKLNLQSRVDLVRYALRQGWLADPSEPEEPEDQGKWKPPA